MNANKKTVDQYALLSSRKNESQKLNQIKNRLFIAIIGNNILYTQLF